MKNERLNFANNEDFEIALNDFGGEAYLKENFPLILQMLYNTREWHRQTAISSDNIPTDYKDTFRLMELLDHNGTSSKTSVYADSLMSLVKQTAFLHMSSDVLDPKCKKIFGSFAVYDENVHKMEKGLLIDHSYLSYSCQPEVEVRTSFVTVDKVNGKDVCTAAVKKTLKVDLNELSTVVKKITVNEPAPKKPSDTFIRVVYNGRTDEIAAYNFAKANIVYIENVRYVDVFYPFYIQVMLDDMFEFNAENPVALDYTFNISLASSVVKGGEVHFNTAKMDNIEYEARGNVLRIALPYDSKKRKSYWHVAMPLTAKQVEGVFDFHLNFSINYKIKGCDEDLQTTVIVSSADLPPSDNLVKIKKSKILWGCLGKDTLVKTENGYKKISEIQIGEKIFTNNSYIRLKNMVTGIQEKIIAVGVSEDKTLKITNEHPIATDRGIIQAMDLAVTDKLMVEDGTFKDIYYLEYLDYNDKVYSPELETSALISANGIMVGDYLTPINSVKEELSKCQPIEAELLEELKRWTALKNERLQKEVNF